MYSFLVLIDSFRCLYFFMIDQSNNFFGFSLTILNWNPLYLI